MNTPKLRFKEFNDEYKTYKFYDVAKLYRGSSPRPIVNFITKSEDSVNWIKIGDVFPNETYINSTSEKITKEGAKKSRRVYKGEIILSNSMSFGRPYILNLDGCIHDGWFVVRDYEKLLNKKYLYHFMSSPLIQKQYKTLSAGGVVSNISSELVYSVKLNIPSKEEQLKVAKFLSLLDKKIELQSKKIEDLKLFKLSKYSSVFSKTNNKIKLSDICIIEKGKQINSDLLIEKGNYYMLNGGILPSGYLNEYNTNENTITISEGGNSCGYVNFNKTKFWCGGHCYKIISPSVNTFYLYHLLKYNEKKIMDLRVGSGLPNIQKKDLEALRLSINKNDEQLKIGILFDTFDKKINLETNKLDKLQELKKGLMQSMFV